MLLVSNAALLGTFVLLADWLGLRRPMAQDERTIVLALFGLWPVGLFFRMPYAESLLLCCTAAMLNGLARGWPDSVVALVAGLATGVRPVGIALTAAFVWHVLMRPKGDTKEKLLRSLLMTPIAAWGLLAFVSYQLIVFGTGFAFAQTQENYRFFAPPETSWLAKGVALLTLEPMWGVYWPADSRYWGRLHGQGDPLVSLYFWNPMLFVLGVAILVTGGCKRWLTSTELILGAGLLGIPYVTRSYEMSMASHGRFAAVVVVNYLVIGRFLNQLTRPVTIAVCILLGLLLAYLTVLYIAGYLVS
jgi:hypothetical protein